MHHYAVGRCLETVGGAQMEVDKRGPSPNPSTFRDLLKILQTLPKGKRRDLPVRALAKLQSRGDSVGELDGGIWHNRMGFGGIQRVLAGFGGNRKFDSVSLGLHPKEGFRVTSNSRPNPFFPSSCARRESDLAPFCQPSFGVCRDSHRQ